ncbi:MAG: capsule biosynthesis protein [Verrucomicrobiota bacterium]|nr:capsule biosynthesis protein [Verrucomicrobiota bacterium]
MTNLAQTLRRLFTAGEPSQVPTDWREVLRRDRAQWEAARSRAQSGPKVLIATSVGGHKPVVTLDTALALALTLAGADVHLLLCDEFLPACERCVVTAYPKLEEYLATGPARLYCRSCFRHGAQTYDQLRLTLHRYTHYATAEDRTTAAKLSAEIPSDEIAGYTLDGIAVGEHASAGALRFFARGTLRGEPLAEPILRHYFHAALLTTFSVRRLLQTHSFVCASFHHGIYVPQGLVGEVARKHGVRVANWQVAYRKRRFIFSHQETYHHTLLVEPATSWESIRWNAKLEQQAMDYLQSRWQGSRDWIYFHEKPQEELSAITGEGGVDFSKPCIGLLTNVMWDAQLHYRTNAFPNMLEWVLQTIAYFAKRPDLQLLVRIHPAEVRGSIPSRQQIGREIREAFPELPPNVFIIPPENAVSTYVAMLKCNAVIIYGTKTGVELTSMGIPVVVAGEAWIRNKGLTLDANSPKEYFELLDRLPLEGRMDEQTTRRARMYAYHFFFRRMIPVECIEPSTGKLPFEIRLRNLKDLKPGRNPGLDTISNGILRGTEFVYRAEEYPAETD